MQTFTHLEFLELEQKEKELKESLNKVDEIQSKYSPKKQTVQTILNYSKALVIKKSKSINYIEVILN